MDYSAVRRAAIFNNTIVALSPISIAACSNVGAGNYSAMLPRASAFAQFQESSSTAYPDLLAQRNFGRAVAELLGLFRSDQLRPLQPQDDCPVPMATHGEKRRSCCRSSHNDSQVPNSRRDHRPHHGGSRSLVPPSGPVFGQQTAGPVDSAMSSTTPSSVPPPSKITWDRNRQRGARVARPDSRGRCSSSTVSLPAAGSTTPAGRAACFRCDAILRGSASPRRVCPSLRRSC